MQSGRKNSGSTPESKRAAHGEGRRRGLGTGCGAHKSVASFQLMFLQTAIHGTAAQPESFGGLADISLMTGKSALDQILFDVVEAHLFEFSGGAGRLRAQAEICRANRGAGR